MTINVVEEVGAVVITKTETIIGVEGVMMTTVVVTGVTAVVVVMIIETVVTLGVTTMTVVVMVVAEVEAVATQNDEKGGQAAPEMNQSLENLHQVRLL